MISTYKLLKVLLAGIKATLTPSRLAVGHFHPRVQC